MQKTYVSKIYELIKKDCNVISCLSDSGTDYDEMIKREFPNQVINFGISENNKIGCASGMASMGKIPFVYTTNAFLAYRSFEFIRDDVCLQNRNVKMIGMGCGLTWSTLGSTHHTLEDISALKALPNLVLLSPASPKELSDMIDFAYSYNGPVYIRIGMGNEKEIYEKESNFKLSKNNVIIKGKDICVFTTGSIISEVLKAVMILEKENISVKVINISTLKPFDTVNIEDECKNFNIVFSVEEHNIIGGLGSSIADVIATNNINCKLFKIGINDVFAIGYGTYEEIKRMNKLDYLSIYNNIKNNIKQF